MAYKILYIEDLNPGSIIHDLKSNGFEAEHYEPENLDELLVKVKNYDLLLLDFRLTENQKVMFDAPTIAQTIRTLGGTMQMDIPIVLISTESKICEYYKDFSSQDLFDYSVSKEVFLENIVKYSERFNAVIEAYSFEKGNNKNIFKSLDIDEKEIENIDYRIIEKLKSEIYSSNIFAYNNFILNNIIRSIGVLIGEDVLASRLGVSIKSTDWETLKSQLETFKYTGIYSNAYDRWWNYKIENWLIEQNNNSSWRRLNAEQRVQKLIEITGLKNLVVSEKLKHSSGTNFWTICKDTKQPLDTIDGLELHQRDLYPWQEKEYISILSGLESSPLFKFVKPFDREKLIEISKSL
jgi:hypothetical protein